MHYLYFVLASALTAHAYTVEESDLSATKCLQAGSTCAGIQGPIGDCCSGLRCVYEGPDRATCRGPKFIVHTEIDVFEPSLLVQATQKEIEFPESYDTKKCIKLGRTCAGIQGPIGKCCRKAECVYQSPDHAVCTKVAESTSDPSDDENNDIADIELDHTVQMKKCGKTGTKCLDEKECCPGNICLWHSPQRGGECYLANRLVTSSSTSSQADEEGKSCENGEDDGGDEPRCIKRRKQCRSINGLFFPCCTGLECVSDPKNPTNGYCKKVKGF